MILKGERCYWRSLCVLFLVAAVLGASVSAQQQEAEEDNVTKEPNVTEKKNVTEVHFQPKEVKLLQEGKTAEVIWYTNATATIERVWAKMEKWLEAEVANFSEPYDGVPDELDTNTTAFNATNITYYGYININAKFVGFNTLLVELEDEMNNTVARGQMEMTVKLKTDKLTTIFAYITAVLTGIAYFLMGTTIDLNIVKGIAKRPVGPCIGMFCQYILMPLISFGVGLALFPGDSFDDRLLRLGMFLGGCCPGGGASNMWTHLLGGSLDLSIMMTGVSTFISFASLPLWVLSMGPVIISDASFVIPYGDITVTVISLIIPCGIGIALQMKWPGSKLVTICSKIMSPVFAFNISVTFTFGVYAYLYVFTIFDWRMLLAGFLLPALGYTVGSILALIFRQGTPNTIAIGVETGVQNYTIAIIILMLTVSSPAGEIATAMPAAFTLFTPLPLLLLFILRRSYLWIRGRSPHDPKSTDLKDMPKKNSVTKVPAQHNGEDNKGRGHDNLAAELSDKV